MEQDIDAYQQPEDYVVGRFLCLNKNTKETTYTDIKLIDFDIAQTIMRKHLHVEAVEIFNFKTTKWETFWFRDPETSEPLCIFSILDLY